MSRTVTHEQVRSMLRRMLSDVVLTFEDERVDEAILTRFTFVELSTEDLVEDDPKRASQRALDRLDRAARSRDG